MEVILLQDVEKLGLRGDVVDVARGYARNYLLPRRLAENATPARVAELRRVDTERARHEARTAEQAQEIAELLGKTVLRFEVKAGPTGSLFGSVTPSDVADEIWRARKVRVDRRKIAIDPLKRIGRYAVPIELFAGVHVEVKTLVVPEGGELPPEEELAALEAAEAEADAAAVEEEHAEHEAAETAIAEVLADDDGEPDDADAGAVAGTDAADVDLTESGPSEPSADGPSADEPDADEPDADEPGDDDPGADDSRVPMSPTRPQRPELRRTRLLAVGLVAALAALTAAASAPATPSAQRVTIVGDSIMASFDYVPEARRTLGRGLDLRADNAVCRRLVTASCPFQGSTPATAVDVIRARGRTLGEVVVMNVGYNDWSAVYDVDRVMRALRAVGVRRVIWVTLREAGGYASVYAQSNGRIRAADRKWKSLVVADWNARSSGKPWFRSDGLHLTTAGAVALARLLRPLVVAGASST